MTRGQRLGAEFHDVGVVGGVEGEDWFFVGEGVLAQRFCFAGLSGVCDQDDVGED